MVSCMSVELKRVRVVGSSAVNKRYCEIPCCTRLACRLGCCPQQTPHSGRGDIWIHCCMILDMRLSFEISRCSDPSWACAPVAACPWRQFTCSEHSPCDSDHNTNVLLHHANSSARGCLYAMFLEQHFPRKRIAHSVCLIDS